MLHWVCFFCVKFHIKINTIHLLVALSNHEQGNYFFSFNVTFISFVIRQFLKGIISMNESIIFSKPKNSDWFSMAVISLNHYANLDFSIFEYDVIYQRQYNQEMEDSPGQSETESSPKPKAPRSRSFHLTRTE